MITYQWLRDYIQKRYQLDIATANQVASDFIKVDFKVDKIRTKDQAISYINHLEELKEA